MARRAFEVIDVVALLQHWHAGRSKAEVAASVGVNRGTVRKYVAAAEAAGLVPGGPPLSRGEWVELVRGWFPELIDAAFPELIDAACTDSAGMRLHGSTRCRPIEEFRAQLSYAAV